MWQLACDKFSVKMSLNYIVFINEGTTLKEKSFNCLNYNIFGQEISAI